MALPFCEEDFRKHFLRGSLNSNTNMELICDTSFVGVLATTETYSFLKTT